MSSRLLCLVHYYNKAILKRIYHEDMQIKKLLQLLYIFFSLNLGSWHLFNLLLLDYVAHIFQSYIEEEGAESIYVMEQNDPPVLLVYEPSYLWGYFAEEQPQAKAPQPTLITVMQSPSNIRLSDTYSEF